MFQNMTLGRMFNSPGSHERIDMEQTALWAEVTSLADVSCRTT